MNFLKELKISILIALTYILSGCKIAYSQTSLKDQGIPFRMVEISGQRPLFSARLNGYPVDFVIHSNAGFYMQITHQIADSAKVTGRAHVDSYGITRPGQLSSLGRDSAFVSSLIIGHDTLMHSPVKIFEVAASIADQGMVGLRWLYGNRVIVDYAQKRFWLKPEANDIGPLINRLKSSGYKAIPVSLDTETGRMTVKLKINSVVRSMIISTVSYNTLDIAFAKSALVAFKETNETSSGPTGVVEKNYVNTLPLLALVQGMNFRILNMQIEDIYFYSGTKRPSDAGSQVGGMLGADFLIKHKAVVDFGNQVLYVLP